MASTDVAETISSTEKEEIKVIVLNYGQWKTSKVMEEFLSKHEVPFVKVQKARQLSFGFIHFESKEQRENAKSLLAQLTWNGEPLDVSDALPKKDNKRSRKRRRDDQDGDNNKEEKAEETSVAAEAEDAVTPWANVPYETQLERKENEMKKVLVRFVRKARAAFTKKEKRAKVEAMKRSKNSGEQEIVKKQYVPEWLESHGSLFIVEDGMILERTHEADVDSEWKQVTSVSNAVDLISFGGELAACCGGDAIYLLRRSSSGTSWQKICDGPKDAKITSLASLKGNLLCCTDKGDIYWQTGEGQYATGDWTRIAQVDGARLIGIHDMALYAYAPETNEWKYASLPKGGEFDSSCVLSFSESRVGDAGITEVKGMASHHAQILLLTSDAVSYVNSEYTIDRKVPLKGKDVVGMASHKGLCCPLDPIRGSPMTEEYRNKCEFTIGKDEAGEACVGFRLGLFKEGSVVVNSPDGCINVPDAMKKACAALQKLIRDSSWPVYSVEKKTGVWRMLTARYSARTQDLMLMVQLNPAELEEDGSSDELRRVLATTFNDPDACGVKVTSLYVQEYAGISVASESDPVTKLFGEDSIMEEMLGMRFRVSPNAFFQVNTPGAEVLYSLVKDQAKLDDKTLLYDVCCGTGTIGLCAAEKCGKVVGIELSTAATTDAEANAALNKVDNAHFINSKAEDVMKGLLRGKEEDEKDLTKVVAIVDPPRAGLHHQVLRSLRACAPVERIVYVSCNPTKSLIEDATVLCGPGTKAVTGTAFRPVGAMPVDMFPHTPHCEMVMVFDRIDKET